MCFMKLFNLATWYVFQSKFWEIFWLQFCFENSFYAFRNIESGGNANCFFSQEEVIVMLA